MQFQSLDREYKGVRLRSNYSKSSYEAHGGSAVDFEVSMYESYLSLSAKMSRYVIQSFRDIDEIIAAFPKQKIFHFGPKNVNKIIELFAEKEALEKATFAPVQELEKLRSELEVYKREAQQQRELTEGLQEKVKQVCEAANEYSLSGVVLRLQSRGDALKQIADKVFGTPRDTKTAAEIAAATVARIDELEAEQHKLDTIRQAVRG